MDNFSIPTTGLTETTSIELASAIQWNSVRISDRQTLATAYVCQGPSASSSMNFPILLLHGFDSSMLEFRRLLPRLTPHQQIWAVDLLGFGFTERQDDCDISPATIQEHLYAFWQQRIQSPVVLVGASMGGAAAMQFALAFPEAVAKLVLIDSAGYSDGPAMGRFLIDPLGYWVTEKFLRNPKVRQKIAQKAYYDPSFASLDAQRCAALHLDCPNWSKALISFTRSGGYRSLRSQLGSLAKPTLILWGDADRILGTKDAQSLHVGIPQSTLAWVPRCGHVPHLEQPAFTADSILKFVHS